MNLSFNPAAFLSTAAHKSPINGFSFSVARAAEKLYETPSLGWANRAATGISWSAQAISDDDARACLVGRVKSGQVALVIYPEHHNAMVACEKAMPEEILLAMGDILQCLEYGNEPWVRVNPVVLGSAFDIIYSEALKVSFQPEWIRDTSYLNGACAERTDSIKSFVDSFGRRGLLMPCSPSKPMEGSVVIFERYPNLDDSPLVFNAPSGYADVTGGLVDDFAHLHQRLLEAANITVDTEVEL